MTDLTIISLFLVHLTCAVLRRSGTLAITVQVNVTVSPIVYISLTGSMLTDGGGTMDIIVITIKHS